MEHTAWSVCERGLEQENTMPRNREGLITSHPASLPWDEKSKNRDGFCSSSVRRFPITKTLDDFFFSATLFDSSWPIYLWNALLADLRMKCQVMTGRFLVWTSKWMYFDYIVRGLSLNISLGNTKWFPTGALKRQTDRQTDFLSRNSIPQRILSSCFPLFNSSEGISLCRNHS